MSSEHKCPTCDVSKSIIAIREALGVLDNATETWLNTSEDYSMAVAYANDLLDAEIERLRRDDLKSAAWWEFRRRAWLDGVGTARAVSEQALWKIKSALTIPKAGGGTVSTDIDMEDGGLSASSLSDGPTDQLDHNIGPA